MRRLMLVLAAAAVLLAPLAACGKRGAPQPPGDEPNVFPRVYPHEES